MPKKEPLPVVEVKPTISERIGFKQYKKNLLLLIVPVTLFLIFLALTFTNNYFLNKIIEQQPKPFPIETTINPYPFVSQVPLLSLTAKSAIILDTNSQVVIFAKNLNLRSSMASTTKIMSALVALDYFQPNSVLTVKSSGVEGTVLGLVPGQQFYFEDLLYAMFLPSANDAAVAVADNYPGGSSAFVAQMNEKAQALHLSNMH
ncbi:MAG TPA: hypothetical protein VF810_00350, partial [Patescibacteria group bacterium]